MFAVGFSDGTAHIYDTSTLQEKHILNHRDQVRFVAFSTTDQHLATASRKKICLWKCTTMMLVWEFKLNDPLLTMSFNEDNSLLMGATRSNSLLFWDSLTGELINSFQFSDIDESTGREHQHARAPTHAAFSPGLNLLAIVYRQRPIVLWDLEDCTYVGQYSKDTHVYPGPLCFAIIFNPKAEVQLVAAAYDDGEIVTFDPWTQRRRARTNADTAVMQGSRDGTTLVSGDGDGRITIYDFETLKVLYKIDSDEIGIRGFAFSNDGLRFFDVRGEHCNIWEPPVLVRRTEMDDGSSIEPSDDTSVAASPTVFTKTYNDDRVITAMSAPHEFNLIFCGREDGSIAAYSILTGDLITELASYSKHIAIMFLHLSRSGEFLVSVDRSSRVVARRLEILHGPKVAESAPVLDRKAGGVVLEILGSVDDMRILISLSDKDEVWEVETSRIIEIARSKDHAHWRWTQTALTSIPLIYFFNGKVTICDWDSFEPAHLGTSVDLSLAEPGTTPVTAIASSNNNSHICILLAGSRPGLLSPILRVWLTHEIYAVFRDTHQQKQKEGNTQRESHQVSPHAIYDQLAKDIKLVIGVYEDSLIFLTHQGWICSLKLNGLRRETHYSRHFFVPFRFHSSASSLAMHVSSKGSLIIAYKTQVVIFAGGLDFEEKIGWEGDTITPRPSMRSTLGRGRSDPVS